MEVNWIYNWRRVMKIGIDLDGVVIDSETTFRTYED